MQFSLEQTIDILGGTPGVVRAMLSGLDDEWVHNNYGPDTFSPFDIVGHFIHGERTDWLPRARIILEHGEGRPFDPFDRTAQYEDSKGKTIDELLDTFEMLRAENIEALEAMELTPEQLDRRGTHPELGTATLRELLATWAVHDLHHIAQICKAMAYQYGEQVGPWRAYLRIIPKTAASP